MVIAQYRYEGRGFLRDVGTKALEIAGVIGTHNKYPDQLFTGETHAMYKKNEPYNWTGPGTNVKARITDPIKGKPKDKLDEYSKKHDIAYYNENKKLKNKEITKEKFKSNIHQADEDFIKGVESIPNMKFNEIAGSKAIELKRWLEKNDIISLSEFSQSGEGLHEIGYRILSKYQSPTHRLKQRVNKQRGGIAPFLVPIIASLGIEAGKMLLNYLTKKKEGSGIIDKDILMKKIISELDNISPNKQIDILHKFTIH